MKKYLRKVTLIVLLLILVSTLTLAEDITILHTNDTHARLEEGGWAGMGFAKIKTLVEQYKEENPNTIVLDAGDSFHGQIIANLVEGESVARILNTVGYDAMVSGNHDFNYGQDRLLELNEITDFPILAANIENEEGDTILPPYIIKEMDGVKVGIFGLATPETTYKTHPDNVKGLTFKDPVPVAEQLTAELAEEVDVIVALSHLGNSAGSEYTSEAVAEAVPAIDVIVDGHSHSVYKEGLEVNGVLIASAGEYDKNLGVINVEVEERNVINKNAKLITKDEATDVDKDKEVLTALEEIKARNEEITSVVVGETAVELEGENEAVRTQESNLGNLINDAILAGVGAEVSLLNGGSIRSSVDPGEITKGDIISILPFGNFIVVKEINGYELLLVLEHGVSAYPATEGLFPQVAGLKFAFDPDQPVGDRVKWIEVQGEPIRFREDYTVAINDFLAAGGDGYSIFAEAETVMEADGLEELVIEYIQEKGTVSPETEGRIVIKE